MHKDTNIKQILISAITVACAIALPVLFHMVGLGSVFLPMFIPLSIGSFMLNPLIAMMTGAIAPIISSLITAMPPLYPPIAFIMSCELAFFCLSISLLNSKTSLHPFFIMVIALVIDRCVLYSIYSVILPYFNLSFTVFSLYDLFKSFPGIIILLTIVPSTINFIVRHIRIYE